MKKYPIKSIFEIAPKSSRHCHFPCRSPCWNPLPTDSIEDEFARDPGLVRGSYSGSTSPAPSRNPTPGPDEFPALILALAPAPTPALAPTNELFKKFMKAYLKSNQGPKQPLTEREWSLKAKVPEVYYGKLHMDCYHFCQQCKDYFETAEATRTNQTPFAAFFLHRNISVRWTQYKHCYQGEELIFIS